MEWVGPLLEKYGIGATVVVIVAFALWKRILVLGSDADARLKDVKDAAQAERELAEKEKTYREERRIEERANRLLTEEALRNQVGVMRDMVELLKDIERSFRAGGGQS